MPSSACKTCALRSEEHTSELQSHDNLVCRLLLEKKYYCGSWSFVLVLLLSFLLLFLFLFFFLWVSLCCSCSVVVVLALFLVLVLVFFFFNDPAPPEIYPLSLPDAFPISRPALRAGLHALGVDDRRRRPPLAAAGDRKSTRLNSSHTIISYAVFCLKKKKRAKDQEPSDRAQEAMPT